MKHLGIRYTHALRLLREEKYVVRDGQVQEVRSDEQVLLIKLRETEDEE